MRCISADTLRLDGVSNDNEDYENDSTTIKSHHVNKMCITTEACRACSFEYDVFSLPYNEMPHKE